MEKPGPVALGFGPRVARAVEFIPAGLSAIGIVAVVFEKREGFIMRTLTVAAAFLLVAFSVSADESEQFASARRAYAEAAKKVEKKYGKKKETEKGAKKYGVAMAPVVCEYLAAIEAELYAQSRKKDKKDKPLMQELGEKRKELEAEIEKFAANGILIIRWPGGLKWLAPSKEDGGLLIHSEVIDVKEFEEKAFFEFMKLKRRRGKTKFGSVGIRTYIVGSKKKLDLALSEGRHLVQWFYLRSETGKNKLKLELSLSKGDTLENVYVNFRSKGKKKKVTAKLRKGVNVIIIHVINKEGTDIGLSVKAKGKRYQLGKPGRF